MSSAEYRFEDFTEAEYARLLALAAAGWRLVGFDERAAHGRVCLWRHDIDMSPQRALRLAAMEADAGVRATYFVLLHSPFYNALERPVRDALRAIAALGHDMGLHFDAAYYEAPELAGAGLAERLGAEKRVLEDVLAAPVRAFSWHNPGEMKPGPALDGEAAAGMVNASSAALRERFSYCSDANGYWRYRRLGDVLAAKTDERLYVLTHPEWWVPEPLSPRARVSRCIQGRAAMQEARYDANLAAMGRTNVR